MLRSLPLLSPHTHAHPHTRVCPRTSARPLTMAVGRGGRALAGGGRRAQGREAVIHEAVEHCLGLRGPRVCVGGGRRGGWGERRGGRVLVLVRCTHMLTRPRTRTCVSLSRSCADSAVTSDAAGGTRGSRWGGGTQLEGPTRAGLHGRGGTVHAGAGLWVHAAGGPHARGPAWAHTRGSCAHAHLNHMPMPLLAGRLGTGRLPCGPGSWPGVWPWPNSYWGPLLPGHRLR